MRTVSSTPQNLNLTDRLSFKLLALFLLVFFAAFILLWIWSFSNSFLESRVAEVSPTLQPKPIVVDPNLRNELTKVMSQDTVAVPAALRDPFNDRTGIVGLSTAQRAVNGVVTTASGTGGSTGPATGSSSTTVTARTGGSGGAGMSSGNAGPQTSAEEATKQRYAAWLDRASTGDIPLDPRVFSIEDLLPVGVVDGGNGTQEVMFYSEAAGRTISFPVGTMFYDGWLAELRPEGVVFSSGDDRRTYRLRSWARSLRNVG